MHGPCMESQRLDVAGQTHAASSSGQKNEQLRLPKAVAEPQAHQEPQAAPASTKPPVVLKPRGPRKSSNTNNSALNNKVRGEENSPPFKHAIPGSLHAFLSPCVCFPLPCIVFFPMQRAITKQVNEAEDIAEISSLVQAHRGSLNVIHITAILVRLAKLAALPGGSMAASSSSSAPGPSEQSLTGSGGGRRAPYSARASSEEDGEGDRAAANASASSSSPSSPPRSRSKASSPSHPRSPSSPSPSSSSGPKAVCRIVTELLQQIQIRILEVDSQGVVNILHSLAKLHQLDGQRRGGRPGGRARGGGGSGLLPPLSEGSLLSTVADDLLYVSTQLLPSFSPQVRERLGGDALRGSIRGETGQFHALP
jgi:hypothetical protein